MFLSGFFFFFFSFTSHLPSRVISCIETNSCLKLVGLTHMENAAYVVHVWLVSYDGLEKLP